MSGYSTNNSRNQLSEKQEFFQQLKEAVFCHFEHQTKKRFLKSQNQRVQLARQLLGCLLPFGPQIVAQARASIDRREIAIAEMSLGAKKEESPQTIQFFYKLKTDILDDLYAQRKKRGLETMQELYDLSRQLFGHLIQVGNLIVDGEKYQEGQDSLNTYNRSQVAKKSIFCVFSVSKASRYAKSLLPVTQRANQIMLLKNLEQGHRVPQRNRLVDQEATFYI